MFGGNLMRNSVEQVEIKSAKGQKAGTVGGSGETQIELERRLIQIREAKLRKELETLQ